MPASPLAPDRIAELDAFLIELNHASAAAILPLFRTENGLVDKGGAKGFDPVTLADKGGETAIRKLISERYPEHGVIGEEWGEDRPEAEFVWVLDPVDGTRAFIAGLPLWTTLIGLRFQGRPVLGSIGQPFLGEIFLGHAGGSRRIGRDGETPLRVRPCPNLNDAIIGTTDPEGCFDGAELGAWRQVRAGAKL
ncbi:MAG TPA: inositol monophosphatase family protein, partial [Phenylobacterium sp.]